MPEPSKIAEIRAYKDDDKRAMALEILFADGTARAIDLYYPIDSISVATGLRVLADMLLSDAYTPP
jgi:hypothetical protein